MPDVSDVLTQADVEKLRLVYFNKARRAITLESWTTAEGFPDPEELESHVEQHGRVGRYRLQSYRKGNKPAKSCTVRVIAEDSVPDAASGKGEPVQMASQLVRMANQFRELAERSVSSAEKERGQAYALILSQAEVMRDQAVRIAELEGELEVSRRSAGLAERTLDSVIEIVSENPELTRMLGQGAAGIAGKVQSALASSAAKTPE
jgi:hypothetical protein